MSDTENNGSNGSENTANNTPVPENNPAPEAPASTPTPENNPAPEAPVSNPEPVKDEPTKTEDKPAEASSNDPHPPQASTDTPSITDNVVDFSISGSTNISGKVPAGTTVKDAVAKLGGTITGLTLRDDNNKTIYGTATINGPMKITASARASGG